MATRCITISDWSSCHPPLRDNALLDIGCVLSAWSLEGIMRWRSRSKHKEIFYWLGYMVRDATSAVFREVPLPGGEVLRAMDKGLHTTALESAGRKLKELRHKSGTLERSL
jgi:hypothetical protein